MSGTEGDEAALDPNDPNYDSGAPCTRCAHALHAAPAGAVCRPRHAGCLPGCPAFLGWQWRQLPCPVPLHKQPFSAHPSCLCLPRLPARPPACRQRREPRRVLPRGALRPDRGVQARGGHAAGGVLQQRGPRRGSPQPAGGVGGWGWGAGLLLLLLGAAVDLMAACLPAVTLHCSLHLLPSSLTGAGPQHWLVQLFPGHPNPAPFHLPAFHPPCAAGAGPPRVWPLLCEARAGHRAGQARPGARDDKHAAVHTVQRGGWTAGWVGGWVLGCCRPVQGWPWLAGWLCLSVVLDGLGGWVGGWAPVEVPPPPSNTPPSTPCLRPPHPMPPAPAAAAAAGDSP